MCAGVIGRMLVDRPTGVSFVVLLLVLIVMVVVIRGKRKEWIV